MSSTLQVVAIIHVKPGQGEAVHAALARVVAASRNEAGCRRYDLFADTANPDRLVMVEEWASKEAMASHVATPHFKELGVSIGALIDLDIIELAPLL